VQFWQGNLNDSILYAGCGDADLAYGLVGVWLGSVHAEPWHAISQVDQTLKEPQPANRLLSQLHDTIAMTPTMFSPLDSPRLM
jgi:hypothetical protein